MELTLTARLQFLKRKSVVGQAVVVLLSLQFLFLSAFVALNLPVPNAKNLSNYRHDSLLHVAGQLKPDYQLKVSKLLPDVLEPSRPVRFELYVPETPAAIFIGYVLGPWLGAISSAAFVLLGLIGPFIGVHSFASGGGFAYYREPSFGYLLGMVLASFVSGWITAPCRTSIRQVLAVIAGLACVHFSGLTFLLGSCLASGFFEGLRGYYQWHQWVFEEVRNLSWYTLPYDLVFALAFIALGAPFKWLVATLTAADMGSKNLRAQAMLEEFGE